MWGIKRIEAEPTDLIDRLEAYPTFSADAIGIK
jgi:hypothetical protein